MMLLCCSRHSGNAAISYLFWTNFLFFRNICNCKAFCGFRISINFDEILYKWEQRWLRRHSAAFDNWHATATYFKDCRDSKPSRPLCPATPPTTVAVFRWKNQKHIRKCTEISANSEPPTLSFYRDGATDLEVIKIWGKPYFLCHLCKHKVVSIIFFIKKSVFMFLMQVVFFKNSFV